MSVNCIAKPESEHQIQAALIQWWDSQARAWGYCDRCLFAIPNGGMRNPITARLLKAEGVRAGVPDLMLAIPNGKFAGLFIELKRNKDGKATKEQQTYKALLNEAGYLSVICKGFDAAKDMIERYLGKKPWESELPELKW